MNILRCADFSSDTKKKNRENKDKKRGIKVKNKNKINKENKEKTRNTKNTQKSRQGIPFHTIIVAQGRRPPGTLPKNFNTSIRMLTQNLNIFLKIQGFQALNIKLKRGKKTEYHNACISPYN